MNVTVECDFNFPLCLWLSYENTRNQESYNKMFIYLNQFANFWYYFHNFSLCSLETIIFAKKERKKR